MIGVKQSQLLVLILGLDVDNMSSPGSSLFFASKSERNFLFTSSQPDSDGPNIAKILKQCKHEGLLATGILCRYLLHTRLRVVNNKPVYSFHSLVS